ncbi:hypothetical protein R1sor_012617 [Riccia sorocarpa]|uniref:Uncharacterized protein n=1 Tax=Riccia sorocarpa TaxID=122646 RepID=A0ABD3I4Z8_9MARC
MERRDENLFGRRISIGSPFSPTSVMGTPFPDSPDSDDGNTQFYQVLSSQPIRPRSRPFSQLPRQLPRDLNFSSHQMQFPAHSQFLPGLGIPPPPNFFGQIPSGFYAPPYIPAPLGGTATEFRDATAVPANQHLQPGPSSERHPAGPSTDRSQVEEVEEVNVAPPPSAADAEDPDLLNVAKAQVSVPGGLSLLIVFLN